MASTPPKSTSLGDRRRARTLALTALTLAPPVAYLVYQYYRYHTRRQCQYARALQFQHATDLSALVGHFYTIIEQYSGGASATACVRDTGVTDEGGGPVIVVFGSGGWAQCPSAQYQLPVYQCPTTTPTPTFTTDTALDIQTLDRYWLARSLSQSRLYNLSFALVLSLITTHGRHGTSDGSLQYNGSHIRQLSLCIGKFVSDSRRPAIDVVCEIGTINDSKICQYQESNWGQSPDLASPRDFVSVVDFGTSQIEDYFRKEGRLPARENAYVERVVWDRQRYRPADSDCWLSIETADDAVYHLDLSAAQHGLNAGRYDWEHYDSKRTVFQNYCYERNKQNNSDFDIFDFASCHPTARRPLLTHSPTPLPCILTNTQFLEQGGKINEKVVGAKNVINYFKERILNSSGGANAEYRTLVKLVEASCRDRKLPTQPLFRH